jgi:hypothetical protein
LTSRLSSARRAERPVERRPFEAWSIRIPDRFSETFVEEGSYWHAWTTDRAVSLTSVVLTDRRGRAVPVDQISKQLDGSGILPDGEPVLELPPGCVGTGVIAEAVQPAVASKLLSGFLVAGSRVLIVTITSDDLRWARATWLSIRGYPTALRSRAERRPKRPRR